MKPKADSQLFYFTLTTLYILSISAILYLLIDNWSYYASSPELRLRMAKHDVLKPSGLIGQGIGILGSLMMVLLLAYSLRKRVKIFSGLGKLNRWLNVHIFFGIIGPLLVTMHTAFKFNGIVAVSFWSMVAVALSGFIGRYIYVQIPRNIHGQQLSMKEMELVDQEFNRELIEKFNFSEEMIKEIESLAKVPKEKSEKSFGAIMSLLQHDFAGKARLRQIKNEYVQTFHFPAKKVNQMMKIARKKAKLERRIQLLNKVQSIFHYWHIIHKPFAIIMYLIMIIHISVAILFGYTWIF